MPMPATYLRRPPRYGGSSAYKAEPGGPLGATATYGITAVRHDTNGHIDELMFGLLDPANNGWALAPSPVKLIEVVDRLLDGDHAKVVDQASDGSLRLGPLLCVKMLESGAETLEAVGGDDAGFELQALPRF